MKIKLISHRSWNEKTIVVTDNLYMVKGLRYYYPEILLYLSYNDFFEGSFSFKSDGYTYLFDVFPHNYKKNVINIIKKIKNDRIDLKNNFIIIWGVENNDLFPASFNGINFMGTNESCKLALNILAVKIKSESIVFLSTDLTQKELQVLKRLSNGIAPASISKALHLSIKTISAHKRNVMTKFGFKNNLSFFLLLKSFF